MSGEMHVDISRTGDGAVLAEVSGEIDLANVERFRRSLHSAAGAGERLVVDLTGVTYLDSAGIAALFARARAGTGTGPLEVRFAAESVVAPLIEITRLGDVAAIRKE